jgi:hypothetical protein
MSMDKTIGQLFKEKNDKILLEKLLFDISNNDNSLRLIVVNRINLISMKFQKRVNDFLKDNSIEYDLESLEKIITEYKEKILGIVNNYLDKRKSDLEQGINDESKDEEEVDEKSKLLDDFSKLFNEVIYIEMLDSFCSKYQLRDEEKKEEFINKYLKKYDFDLSDTLVDSILDRNQTLKNIMAETIKKVDVLNDMTSNKYLEKKQ